MAARVGFGRAQHASILALIWCRHAFDSMPGRRPRRAFLSPNLSPPSVEPCTDCGQWPFAAIRDDDAKISGVRRNRESLTNSTTIRSEFRLPEMGEDLTYSATSHDARQVTRSQRQCAVVNFDSARHFRGTGNGFVTAKARAGTAARARDRRQRCRGRDAPPPMSPNRDTTGSRNVPY